MFASVWSYVLFFMTNNICNTANNGPRVHHALPTSYHCLCLQRSIIEPAYHLPCYDFSVLLLHLQADSQDHQHVVNSVDAHGVDVTHCVAARDSPLHVGVIDQRIEKVCRRDQMLRRVM